MGHQCLLLHPQPNNIVDDSGEDIGNDDEKVDEKGSVGDGSESDSDSATESSQSEIGDEDVLVIDEVFDHLTEEDACQSGVFKCYVYFSLSLL